MTPTALIRWVAAQCLCYPDERLLREQLPLMREALAELAGPSAAPEHTRSPSSPESAGDAAAGLPAFLDHLAATPELDLAAHYVATFDSRNRRCLYLTWWTTGDTRNRGAALVAVKDFYRRYGMAGDFGGELPDFLPVMLEFAALAGDAAGTELLDGHRAGLELLRLSVEQSGSPYAAVLRAVCGTLPGPSPRTREEAKALARSGPPQELVGIDLAPAPIPASALWQKVTS
ncbi:MULTISPECIES: nitrate reductase molybdenum cofactor assembly chaperone [Streptomyces]|uniref:nitrate reductase molybdenum cofactor assembly chaperone n=1 Tax=Streptomyces TaxID=1883 RepID=UPI000699884C|nr:nitrate reductase molybdenum cofactor assembly chaperone [Streptomyces sp. SID7805]MYU51483.1 nitrate reductase molybdenum cofactor assembly chaperone [Streptomyces sp. SID7805]